MNDSGSQLDAGSSGGNFQPSNQNPQTIGNGSLQTPVSNLQSTQTGNATSGEQMFQRVDNGSPLTVQTAGYSSGSVISETSPIKRTDVGLMTLTGVLLIILIIGFIVQHYWRKMPAAETLVASDQPPEPEVVVEPTAVVESEVLVVASEVPAAPRKVSKKKKKPASKKKKKRNKKR